MKFYQEYFGYELDLQEEKEGVTMAWFPMEMNKMGAAGTLIKGGMYKPSHEGLLVYFSVPSVEEYLPKVEALGGKILMPKTSIGQHGFIGWIQDTEGNRVAIHSMAG